MGFDRTYPRLFSDAPFDDGWYSKAANDLPEVRRLNQRAVALGGDADLHARVRARITTQRNTLEP